MRIGPLLLVVLLAPCLLQAQGFSLERTVFPPEANSAWSLAKGDLDGDGAEDLAISTSDHIGVYFNEGNGIFTAQQYIASADRSRQVALVDLDQDGALDITWTNWSAPNVQWARNIGARAFAAASGLFDNTFSGYLTNGIAWGDLDQDGDLDMALAFDTPSNAGLACLYNNGSEVFSYFNGPLTYFVPNGYRCGMADLNNDGELDVVGVGDGIYFIDNDDLNTGSNAPQLIASFTGGRGLVIVDRDGDGQSDILATANTAGQVWEARGNGNGQFTTGVHMANTPGASGIAVLDVDDDGAKDVLVACAGDNSIHATIFGSDGVLISDLYGAIDVVAMDALGNGGPLDIVSLSQQSDELAFHRAIEPWTYAQEVELTPVSGHTSKVRSADLNGDGINDIVARYGGSRSLAWRAGTPNGGFSHQERITDQISGFMYSLDIWDQDLDGDNDLLAIHDNGSLVSYRNDGTGAFTNDTISSTCPGAYAIGDVDLDGDADVLCEETAEIGMNKLMRYLNDGQGAFGQGVQVGELYAASMQLVDLNDDGSPDLLTYANNTAARIHFNDGTGFFEVATTVPAAVGIGAVDAVDVDGNGVIDIVLPSLTTTSWLPGAGNGTFGAPITIIPTVSGTQHSGNTFSDLDGDGDKDLVTGTTITGAPIGHVSWYRNDGPGFTLVSRIDQNFGDATALIEITDLDDDGDPDIVLYSASSERIATLENFFTSPFRIEGMLYHDLNGDGSHDASEAPFPFHVLNCSPEASIPYSNAAGEFSFRTDAGSYAVSASSSEDLWQVTSDPMTHVVELTNTSPVASNIDFGFEPSYDTLWLDIASTSGIVRCGQNYPRWIDIVNRGGLVAEDVTVDYFLDPSETAGDFVPMPSSIAGNHLQWSFEEIPALATVHISLVSSTGETPGSSISDSLRVEAEHAGSASVWTNQNQRTVLCSYDPNDKQVSPIGFGVHGAVDIDTRELQYTIRFQNTGTDTAFFVMLRDRLASGLDPLSIRVLGASHTITGMVVEADRELVVIFEDIELPDSTTNMLGSMGYVVFAIGVEPDQAHGTVINNSVDIYFDVNAPVITNTTRTTLVDCSIHAPAISLVDGFLLRSDPGAHYQWYLDDAPIAGAVEQDLLPSESGGYSVEVISEFGCTARTPAYPVISTGLSDTDRPKAVIIPNPFSTMARVVFSESLSTDALIVLSDVTGRQVKHLRGAGLHEVLLDREGLAAGHYTLHIEEAGRPIWVVRAVID